MSKYAFGLTKVEMGAIESDGGMSLALEPVGDTVSESMQLTSDDPTITDFKIEESDSPVKSISTPGKVTLAWSCYNVDGYTMSKFFGGTYTPYKSIATFGSITAGTSYTNGTYKNVALSGGTGQQARATIVVTSGGVSSVTLTHGGYGYTVADTMTAAAADIGGTGSGFSVPVATLTNGSGTYNTWSAPDAFPSLELSVKLTTPDGTTHSFARMGIAPKVGVSFSKTKLGQVDITATILQPTKSGEKRWSTKYSAG